MSWRGSAGVTRILPSLMGPAGGLASCSCTPWTDRPPVRVTRAQSLGFHAPRNAGLPLGAGPGSPVQTGEGSQSPGEAADRTPLSQQTVPLFHGIVPLLGSTSISLPPLARYLLKKRVWTLVWLLHPALGPGGGPLDLGSRQRLEHLNSRRVRLWRFLRSCIRLKTYRISLFHRHTSEHGYQNRQIP